jgi:TonB family protein
MRIFTIIVTLLLTVNATFGQIDKIEYLLNAKVQLTDKIDQGQKENTIFLKTEFASSFIINPSELNKIQDNVILKIELVFTTFKSSQTFDQKALNRKRLQSLNRLDSEILKNEMIEWKVIGQTACSSPRQGDNYFHGFIITYRPTSTEETFEKEIEYIEKVLKGKDPYSETAAIDIIESEVFTIVEEMPIYKGGEKALFEYLSKSIKYPSEAKEKSIQGIVYISFVINENGEVTSVRPLKGIGAGCDEEAVRIIKSMPKWIPGKQSGKPVSTALNLPIRFNLEGSLPVTESVFYSDEFSASDTAVGAPLTPIYIGNYVSDSTVVKILNRNSTWNKMLVVCDFTGSMSPYTAQLLVWHKLNIETNKQRIEYFTFFNDGDRKPDQQKQIGKTGGIYHSQAKNFNDIKDLAQKTMRGGFGGDTPENNIEALLEAIEKCENCNDIIMIADNFATPRDLSLLKNINKPIKMIMCGTFGGINPAYLDIAKQTKGSLHTIEEDIMNLMELNEGEEITIGGRKYQIKRGKFVPIYKF